ncbi:MAG: histidine phosphatase family protein [Oscillospiraceae bacterium]|nr:histidine phosphatase family protein [Oscillospiraceae bacterium]
MKLLIVRHGDPDYEHDTLTETGFAEAACVAERLRTHEIRAFYVSPLGRAQDTARFTLNAMNREAETLPWLREFHAPILHPDTGDVRVPWDWLPAAWTAEPMYYDKDQWCKTAVMQEYGVDREAQRVYDGLDTLLAKHGYFREGMVYRAVRPNCDTLCLFCHFGVSCVMIGHLIGCSPMVLWHGLCAAPATVTVLTTEERRQGIAAFRMNAFGDSGHFYAAGREPSFSARFCEMFSLADERHD